MRMRSGNGPPCSSTCRYRRPTTSCIAATSSGRPTPIQVPVPDPGPWPPAPALAPTPALALIPAPAPDPELPVLRPLHPPVLGTRPSTPPCRGPGWSRCRSPRSRRGRDGSASTLAQRLEGLELAARPFEPASDRRWRRCATPGRGDRASRRASARTPGCGGPRGSTARSRASHGRPARRERALPAGRPAIRRTAGSPRRARPPRRAARRRRPSRARRAR